MREQLKLIPGVFFNPKSTFKTLPSHRLYILAWIAPLYFGIARVFRPPTYGRAIQFFGSPVLLFLFVILVGIIIIPLSAWIMCQILKLFRKRLSVKKLMNIGGYALVPRLVVAIIGYIILAISPGVFYQKHLTPALVALIILGAVGILYTLFLFFYGIIISPSEE